MRNLSSQIAPVRGSPRRKKTIFIGQCVVFIEYNATQVAENIFKKQLFFTLEKEIPHFPKPQGIEKVIPNLPHSSRKKI